MKGDGTYTGSDGRRYRWVQLGVGYQHQACVLRVLPLQTNLAGWEASDIVPADIPRAIAALQELTEEEESDTAQDARELLEQVSLLLKHAVFTWLAEPLGLLDELHKHLMRGVELIEQEEDEWVEINPNWRMSRNGERVQCRLFKQGGNFYKGWTDRDSRCFPGQAYRKGREVALAERDEKAQALAEAVLRCDTGFLPTDVVLLAREVKGEKP